jgi:hypothetical protein
LKTAITYSECCSVVQGLGIISKREYKQRYKEDVRLPATPEHVYKAEWQDWSHFLNRPKRTFYPTLAEARQAVVRLGIVILREYKRRYKEDAGLPATPEQVYKAEWQDWSHFLDKPKRTFYPTLAEARQAVVRLGITLVTEYYQRYKEDAGLPATPDHVYKAEWQDWSHFLDRSKKILYPTLAEARQAVVRLGITLVTEYYRRYKEDACLPSTPEHFYKAEWQDWPHFLDRPKITLYPTLAEARQAMVRLGITSRREYYRRYKEDAGLPAAPEHVYKAEWQDWSHFLDRPKRIFYPILAEARQAVLRLGITSVMEYKQRYKEDASLPANPALVYKAEWQDWSHFLEMSKRIFHPTLAEARQAVVRLGITFFREYKRRYKEDAGLPANPAQVYKAEWQDWSHFLGNQKAQFYTTLAEASQAAINLGITSSTEYSRRYKEDPSLPSAPDFCYATEWQTWSNFLLLKRINTLKELKQACKVLQIKDSGAYRESRKQYKSLPAHPERLDGWVDWYDLLGIPVPYKYEELVSLVRKAGCNNLDDYKKFRLEAEDPKIPASPSGVYENSGWTNTYDFFGKPRPYQTRYLESHLDEWARLITEFLKQARGGITKQQELCQFVRNYIQAEGLDNSPYDFLTRTKVNVKPLIDLLNQLPVHKKKRQLYSINEFLDWIIQTELTIEDEFTGEILRLKNAANPLKNINFDNEQYIPTVNETAKPSLPYQFVKAGRDWIFPSDSAFKDTSYGDLTHLQKFPSDWIQISDPTKLDYNDPDCVIKTEQGKAYLWNPIFWTYTYALMQLPARGMQIVYCDSGEMDETIPDFKDGNLFWRKNPSERAGLTKRQGMIYKTENGDFGVHYTSNKTQLFGDGYDVPYMPTELAYWLVKLRKWQQKYNPIDKPTPWLECTRTNLNETQRAYKGTNCFLFRDMHDFEPGTFGGRLTDRLAAALFFSAQDETALATFKDCKFTEIGKQLETEASLALSRFSSSFTPHSMRVSLINAYAFEFGLPLEVIMKLVGHASMVMTVYYMKSSLVREKIELGEKQVLKNSTENARRFIDEQGIEAFRAQLTANNPEILNALSNKHPSSVYLWKDFGICPVGGNSCTSGGDIVVNGSYVYNAVPAGYIGEQNCPRCRFFITGPAFLIGLIALFNEILLVHKAQRLRHSELEDELKNIVYSIDVISNKQYENYKYNSEDPDLAENKKSLQAKRRKLNSEIETRTKKIDMLLTDLCFIKRHINNSRAVVEKLRTTNDNKLMLIVPNDLDFDIKLEDTTFFHLLSEVCENAELFHSCSNESALAKRSQLLDKLLINNGMQPQLLLLEEKEQMIVGNQISQLMYSRIKSWDTIDRLIDGELTLRDLGTDLHLTAQDIKELFARAKPIGIGESK